MTDKDLDIHAFPMAAPEVWDFSYDGMGLRDWFAGQALAGMMSVDGAGSWTEPASHAAFARCAYAIAQAMLVERQKYEKKD